MSIEEIANKLKESSTIIYPTDTIWGLGCDATDQVAINKIFDIKSRDESKSFIVLFKNLEMIERYSKNLSIDKSVFQKYTDKPTTYILDIEFELPGVVKASDGTLGIRIPNDAFCQTLLSTLDRPIISTSVNKSGRPSAILYEDIDKDILKKVDIVIEKTKFAGTMSVSRIVRIIDGDEELLRE